MHADRLALDKSSVRTKDADGHLHVAETPISKAEVSGYLGAEIPGYKELGLDPKRLYQLLRDPKELEKSASTFNGKPLLIVHKPVSAEDHDKEITVGAVTNAEWRAPYLMARLDVWDGEAISLIESRQQSDISCGYWYDLDPTPGTYEGQPYDGVMRNLRGNHVAMVEEGRVSGAFVADEKPKMEQKFMASRALLSRKASVARGALAMYLRPKLAVDAKIDLPKLLSGVTAANYKARKPALAASITKATTGKLAQDASLEDLTAMLDALDDEGMNDPDGYDADPKVDPEDTNPPAPVKDADPMEAVKAFLKDKISPEDHAQMCSMMEPGAKDEPPPFAGKPEMGKGPIEGGKPAMTAAKDKEPEPPMTKGAMDSAIRAAAADAEKRTIARMNAIRAAEHEVAPLVGKLEIAFDSAEAVYKHALSQEAVDHEGVHPSAYAALVRMRIEAKAAKPAPRMASDSASSSGLLSRFPDAKRIGF